MTAARATPYLSLKADDRQDIRMPSLLKTHLAQVAGMRGQSVSEYLVTVIADRVSAELAKPFELQVTTPEFVNLVKILTTPEHETPAMAKARARHAKLTGARARPAKSTKARKAK